MHDGTLAIRHVHLYFIHVTAHQLGQDRSKGGSTISARRQARRSVLPRFRLEPVINVIPFASNQREWRRFKGLFPVAAKGRTRTDMPLRSYPSHPSLLVRVTFARDDQRRHSSQARICGIAFRTQADKPCVTIRRGN